MRARRTMFAVLAMITLLAAAPADARPQTHFEMSLVNTGPLATEVTHYVRPAQTPGSLQLGAGMDDLLFGRTYLTVGATLSLATVSFVECSAQPCAKLSRYERARGRVLAEPSVLIATPRVGLRQDLPGPVDISAGIASPILQGPDVYFGATPMASKAVWAELQARAAVRSTRVAAFARYTAIGPHKTRFTVTSEWSGYKRVGEDFPNKLGYDPIWIRMIEAGARIYAK